MLKPPGDIITAIIKLALWIIEKIIKIKQKKEGLK